MLNYSYNKNCRYDIQKIRIIQSFWRQNLLKHSLINKQKNIFNYNVVKYLELPENINYYEIITSDIDNSICKYDKKIIKLIRSYQYLLIQVILSKKYDKKQLCNNIKKFILIIVINNTIKLLNNFFIDINDIETITSLYLNIYNSNIDHKYETLKNIINQHIKKTECILEKYNNLGYYILEPYIKKINNVTYLKLYNKYITNINSNINVNNIYELLSNFISCNDIYDLFSINKDINIENLKQNNIIYNIRMILNNIY